ncbi:MAG: hypothetical protein M3R24_31700 [Chloroflexota bacterium]|nr:hypothetical protein [Chloroflexota bacterium]
MSEAQTIPAKHIFLDIVGFTHNRSVEAQSDLVGYLNTIVQSSVEAHIQDKDRVIYLPTGDGLCICLLNIETPYDIHLLIATSIIEGVSNHNNSTDNEMRKFSVRIGINQNIDNLVTDVNGKRNIAGAGINMAARVMSMADDNQILVGEPVYDTLRYREKYMRAFRGFTATVKHGVRLNVYQLIDTGNAHVNVDVPKAFQQPIKTNKKLHHLLAYYMAHAIRNRPFFLTKVNDLEYTGIVLLWFLAKDSIRQSEATETEPAYYKAYKAGEVTIQEQYQYYDGLPFDILSEFGSSLKETHLYNNSNYFDGIINFRFVNDEGKRKLKQDWPNIWNEFDLDNVT